ncbi:MAG: hypothetical protein H6765_03970 [Candidatus Peribacteria bacterium]|nr:MAG: hypothetical protein H6765_03970 [Candidatus Peribacteria bacterium]
MALFSFFVSLYKQGKKVRVLAGNHDWIHEHFVFAEGQWAFEVMQSGESNGSLQFITQPCFAEIEGQDILFFPFTHFSEEVVAEEQFQALCEDSHVGMQQSGRANSLLYRLVQEWRSKQSPKELLILHHRYLVDTVFPGQQARFSYKSPGLSSHWLHEDDIRLLSGHLHQPFVHKNYCCVGSVWSTSPLEINQLKFVFVRKDGRMHAEPLAINPYLSLEVSEKLSAELLEAQWQQVVQQSCQHLQGGKREIAPVATKLALPLSQTTLYVRGDALSYETLPEQIEKEVLQNCKDYKIKQSTRSLDTALSSLEDSSLQLDERIADWKTLLQRFLQAKYGQDYENYYELLQELEIL